MVRPRNKKRPIFSSVSLSPVPLVLASSPAPLDRPSLNAHKLPFFVSISDDDFFFVNDCPLGQAIEGDGTAKYLCL